MLGPILGQLQKASRPGGIVIGPVMNLRLATVPRAPVFTVTQMIVMRSQNQGAIRSIIQISRYIVGHNPGNKNPGLDLNAIVLVHKTKRQGRKPCMGQAKHGNGRTPRTAIKGRIGPNFIG